MPYSTAAIANWFLDRADQDALKLDPMKLQKLIYFAHGWYLALADGKPLIDEHPQAWSYGPVIPTIYHEFKEFGRGPITARATEIELLQKPGESAADRLRHLLKASWHTPKVEDPDIITFLEQIWSVYGHRSGVQLANLSHIANGAWDQAYRASNGKRNVDISDALIRAEFEEKKTRGAAA